MSRNSFGFKMRVEIALLLGFIALGIQHYEYFSTGCIELFNFSICGYSAIVLFGLTDVCLVIYLYRFFYKVKEE